MLKNPENNGTDEIGLVTPATGLHGQNCNLPTMTLTKTESLIVLL